MLCHTLGKQVIDFEYSSFNTQFCLDVREHKLAHQLRRKDREFRFGNVGEYKLSAKERRQLK
jgi:hypothetical protein